MSAKQGVLHRQTGSMLTHREWVEKVAVLCSILLDERQWAYERTVRAVEAIYGPCPPKK